MLSFTLLGNVELSRNGESLSRFRSQKELALLIYLAQTGQSHRREFIAELLWDSSSTKQALSNLRTVLARLQQQVGDDLVVTHKSLALAPASLQQVDSVTLLQALDSIEQITSAETAASCQKMLDIYRGEFLTDLQLRNAPAFDNWAIITREYIHRQVTGAYHKLGQYMQSAGDVEQGIAFARRWLQVDALDEAAHMLLLRFLIEAGNTREAMAHYDDCAELLQTELGIEPSPAMTALIKDVQPKRAAASRPTAAARHNVPAAHDQFFGRRAIQHNIHLRLAQPWCRLVTIVGPGGVGKTRLATTIAYNRLSHYPDGVWLVELANLDPNDDNLADAIAVEIATVLDLRFTGSAQPATQLLDYLQHRQLLLVLDNFEHLLPGIQVVVDIVQRCEHVQMLVTSREALRLRAEWTIALTGLSYPSSNTDDTPVEAVELFVARRDQQQWEALSDDDQASIRSICHLVEGLPLAIELAAALTRDATPRAVAERLQKGFDALTTTLRDMPQRHQSLQIVFEMSWRTLTLALQQQLARLWVFRGGFTAAAALDITQSEAADLAALCEKSLLSYNKTSDRYILHPVVRAYASEKHLAADQTPERHARYYLALLALHSDMLRKSMPQDSVLVLEPDIDNLRLAWQTGLAGRRADWLLAALMSLSIYYQLRGLAREAQAVMHATVDTAAEWNELGIRLATRAGLEWARFQNRLGRYWPAMQAIQTTLKLAAEGSDRWAEGMAHVMWGESLWRLGRYDAARGNLGHALAIADTIHSTEIIGWCHHHLGIIDDIQSRYDAAHDHLQQACDVWRSLENTNILSVSLNSIGLVCYHQGDLPAAKQAMEQALELCTQLDNRHAQALLLNNLSMLASEQGDYTGAQYYLQLGLELAIATGNLTAQGEIYPNIGRNYRLMGEIDLAVEHLEQGLWIAESLGNRSSMAMAMLRLAEVKREQADSSRAETLYNQALQIAQQDNLSHIECELSIGMAELLRTSNRQQARQYSVKAVALAGLIGNPTLLERANAIAGTLQLSADMKQNLSA